MTTPTSGLLLENPYQVPAWVDGSTNDPAVDFYVVHQMVEARNIVAGFIDRSPRKVGVRLSGGCKNMSLSDRLDMVEYFRVAFAGFSGFLSSGGTREVNDDGQINPTVCDLPAALLYDNPDGIITLSTLPRVGKMQLKGNSRLVVADEWGDVNINPGVHCVVMAQAKESHVNVDWKFDIKQYLEAYQIYVRLGWPFVQTIWNGGAATVYEAFLAAHDYDWPVILIEGSNRVADWIAHYLRTGSWNTKEMGPEPETSERSRANFVIAHRDDPQTLRSELVSKRILQAA